VPKLLFNTCRGRGPQFRTFMRQELRRSPLASIKASVTALLADSRLGPSHRNELLVVINEEADRLNQLVAQAMETVQLAAGLKLSLKPHAIAEIIDAARKDRRRLLGRRSVYVQLQPRLPAVHADLNRVKKSIGAVAGKCDQVFRTR